MNYPTYKPQHTTVSYGSYSSAGTTTGYGVAVPMSTSSTGGHFATAASSLEGGVTTDDITSASNGPARAGTSSSWGWSGGIEPPNEAPIGDGIGLLLILSVVYVLYRKLLRKS